MKRCEKIDGTVNDCPLQGRHLKNCQRESFFDNDLEQSCTSKRGNEFLVEKLTLERVWVAAYALETSKANKYQVTGMMWWFLVELSLVTDCDRGLTQRPDPPSLNCLMVSIATWGSVVPFFVVFLLFSSIIAGCLPVSHLHDSNRWMPAFQFCLRPV